MGKSPFASHQHENPLGPGNGRIDKVSLQHGIMMHQKGKHHKGILAPLRLMDGYRIGIDQLIQLDFFVENP